MIYVYKKGAIEIFQPEGTLNCSRLNSVSFIEILAFTIMSVVNYSNNPES